MSSKQVFINILTLEENPLEQELPEEVNFFDLEGNEVRMDEAE